MNGAGPKGYEHAVIVELAHDAGFASPLTLTCAASTRWVGGFDFGVRVETTPRFQRVHSFTDPWQLAQA